MEDVSHHQLSKRSDHVVKVSQLRIYQYYSGGESEQLKVLSPKSGKSVRGVTLEGRRRSENDTRERWGMNLNGGRRKCSGSAACRIGWVKNKVGDHPMNEKILPPSHIGHRMWSLGVTTLKETGLSGVRGGAKRRSRSRQPPAQNIILAARKVCRDQ